MVEVTQAPGEAHAPLSRHMATGSRLGMIYISPEIIDQMKTLRVESRNVSIMQLFGISDKSWRRIRSGEPLRHSVAMRLVERLQTGHHLY